MKKAILLCSLFFVLIFLGTAFADTLYLKNGTQFTGRVIRQDAEKVVFRIGTDQDGADITFFSDQILRIDKAQVSNFLTLPMGQGKQISIPRPTFGREPLLSEQARTQQEKRQRIETSEQAEIEQGEDYKTNTTQQEETRSKELFKAAGGESFLQQEKIVAELMPLLNKEELNYFTKINTMVKEPTSSAMRLLSDPTALSQDSSKLQQVINEMPSRMEGIVKQLSNLQPPATFVNFHKEYLDDITLIRDIFSDISKGDIVGSQSKTEKLKNLNKQLQEELVNILSEKKK